MRIAIYARVSSAKQVKDSTIKSQIAVLRDRVKSMALNLNPQFEFVDDGYSGSSLMRPGLESLRDLVGQEILDRVLVLSPDRLARNYAHQYLLAEEFTAHGVELEFMNSSIDASPEGSLLLQVQGVIAEYERAKIAERNRRGKLHAAKSGNISVASGAPYGYQYIKKTSETPASYIVSMPEAKVIRDVFHWIVREGISLNEATNRLSDLGIPTPTGKSSRWNRASLLRMIKNPAYKGLAAFGKLYQVPKKPRVHMIKGSRAPGKSLNSARRRDPKEWILIPVPSIVESDIFDEAQLILERNKKTKRERESGQFVFLRGMIVCGSCSYSYTAANGKYYRCTATRKYAHKKPHCRAKSIRMKELDDAVWSQVKAVLQDPQRLVKEYETRIAELQQESSQFDIIKNREKNLENKISRLIDAFTSELVERQEFEPRIKNLRKQLIKVQNELLAFREEEETKNRLALVISNIEEFCTGINSNLEKITDADKRKVTQSIVDRIEVKEEQVEIVFALDGPTSGSQKTLQHCCRSRNSSISKDCFWMGDKAYGFFELAQKISSMTSDCS